MATEKEIETFRMAVGSLLWLAGNTRPDLSYFASSLASRISTLCVRNLGTADKAIRQAHQHADTVLIVKKLKQTNSMVPTVLCFGDSSLLGERDEDEDADTQTQQGVVIVSCDEITYIEELKIGFINMNLLYWRSAHAARVVVSTFGSESLALVEALVKGISCCQAFDDLLGWGPLPLIPPATRMYRMTDGDSCVSHLCGNKVSGAERRLRGFTAWSRNCVKWREVMEISHLPGAIMVADDVTKNTGGPLILDLMQRGGCHVSHEKAWVRIKRSQDVNVSQFETPIQKYGLAGSKRAEWLWKWKLEILPGAPMVRIPGKPKEKDKPKKKKNIAEALVTLSAKRFCLGCRQKIADLAENLDT